MSDCHPHISIWLKLEKKKISLFLSVHTHRHTRRNRHTLETPFCLAVVFVGLRPNPPPFTAELTAEGWVAGAIVPGLRWARTKKSHNTN